MEAKATKTLVSQEFGGRPFITYPATFGNSESTVCRVLRSGSFILVDIKVQNLTVLTEICKHLSKSGRLAHFLSSYFPCDQHRNMCNECHKSEKGEGGGGGGGGPEMT